MKTYDFDRIVDRHGTNAVKYDALTDVFGSKELLPLWVADMDFATPDFILDALRRRLDHPVLGYTQLPDDYWPQIAAWIEARHGWRPDPAWMRFIPGIVKGIGMAVLALTRPGDKVVIQPPVYHPFRLVPEQMGRRVVCNPLRRTGDRYEMDFEQLEALLDDDCRLLLLSNPHNPAASSGRRRRCAGLAAICDRPRRRGRLGRDPLRHGALRASSPPLRIGQRRGGALQRHLRRPDQDLQHRRRGQFLRDRPRRGAAPPLFRLARSG